MTTDTRRFSEPSLKKTGLSCAECRRSKLKCDRNFPCQACIRRGCANICPDGTLAATKGNKVLAQTTQRLSEQVKTLQARIRELESALGQNNSNPGTSRPATPEKEFDELYEKGLQDLSGSIGCLSIGSDGQAQYHGESAASEYLQSLLPFHNDPAEIQKHPQDNELPYELVELMNAFPFGLKDSPYTKFLFGPYFPPEQRTMQLVDLYFREVAWMYDPISRQDLNNTILTPLYHFNGIANLDNMHSHHIAVFFSVLAAAFTFESEPSSPALARRYFALAKAALSLDPISQEANCATVQAMFTIVRYLYSSDRASNEMRWMLMGLCTRIALRIGLHRDSSGWNLDHEEQQRRRRLFWELYTYDAWTSVVNGRPPVMMIQHTDCRFPEDTEPSVRPNGETELGFHAWKYRYSASCLSISVQYFFSTRRQSYAAVLDLDKKLRKFPIVSHLQSPVEVSEVGRSWSSDPVQAMQQYCVVCERESGKHFLVFQWHNISKIRLLDLLYLHRSYFVQALQKKAAVLQHEYAPSVLAIYRSACRLITSLKGLYPNHPEPTSKCWFFWSGILSACIILSAIVIEAPGCPLAPDALKELQIAVPFYEECSTPCRPPRTVTMLQSLLARAVKSFNEFKAGVQQNREGEETDVLNVLGGQKAVINTSRSTSNSPNAPPQSDHDANAFSHPGLAIPPSDYYEAYNPESSGWSRYAPPAHSQQQLNLPQEYAYPIQDTSALGSFYNRGGVVNNNAMSTIPSAPMQNSNIRNSGPIAPIHTTYNPMTETHARLPSLGFQPLVYDHGPLTYRPPEDVWRSFTREFGLDSSMAE